MTQQHQTADVLNELHQLELRTILPRLDCLLASSGRSDASQALSLGRVGRQAAEHRAWLAQAIDDARGAVWPASMNIQSAGLHYSSAASMAPLVAADIRQLLAAYETALRQPGLSSAAIELIHRISRRHQGLLKDLEPSSQLVAT